MAVLAECPKCGRRQSQRNKWCKCRENLARLKRAKKLQYWIVYRIKGKQHFEKMKGENATSLKYAQDAEAKRKVQRREDRIFDVKPDASMSFGELSAWYLSNEKVKAKAYYPTLQINLNSFNKEFGEIIVGNLKPIDLENYQVKRKALGLSDSYIDQEVGAARTMINKAFDNNLVSGDVVGVFKRVERLLKKKNSNARNKVITLEQFKAIMEGLPAHTRGIVAMGFFTGMRRREIFSLTWDKGDM